MIAVRPHGGDDGGPAPAGDSRCGPATTAPIDGIHGWYFANAGMEPVMVELKLSGYYTLEPGVLEMTR